MAALHPAQLTFKGGLLPGHVLQLPLEGVVMGSLGRKWEVPLH